MFELIATLVIGSLLLGVVSDDEIVRTINTLANLATVALLVWHQRHMKQSLEPKVDAAVAVVNRKLGDRGPQPEPGQWNGVERRKGN